MGVFRSAVESAELARITATLHPDVVFRSPAVHKPYAGRETVSVILGAVVEVFEDFHYVAAVGEGGDEMLRFHARVGDREIDGVDLVTYDDAGLVTELTVMIRPLTGLQAVQQAMAEKLAAYSS